MNLSKHLTLAEVTTSAGDFTHLPETTPDDDRDRAET